ncbi:MAG: IclR family transcriptional regulator [Desulfuromusa sp.]|nr:IclR family transcriptional regulator [Desulfuromusa sp.]
MVKKDKSEYIIQAVSHALDLLEQFHGDIDELGVTELSKRLKLHKNNVFRLLATLESRGYIEQNKATENYRLGLKALELGQTFIKQMGLLRQAKPILEQIVEESNETAYVAIYKENYVVYLDVVETNLTVRVVSRVGSRLPAYCTASGKVHMAYMTEEELDASLQDVKLVPHTSTTIISPEDINAEMAKVREQGYAFDDEELDLGVRCIAAPIRDYTRRIVGALSISGPTMRISNARTESELVPLVLKASTELSTRLGYPK